ncbi:MAG: dienelactone hydrolase family protein [Sphingomonadales bacterium]|nr:dienelactone hydrolase family protein [Sphingomonadales bacterium]
MTRLPRRALIPLAVLVLLLLGLVAFVRHIPPALAADVAVEHVLAPDPDDKPLRLTIWTPRDAAGPLPLVLISHGTGGAPDNHADLAAALVHAGFIVAGAAHTGDTTRDMSYVGKRTLLNGRPRHVVRELDYLLHAWPGRARIDAARIGLYGYSAGGFTGLVVAGGEPDLSRFPAHCRAHPPAWDCNYLKRHGARLDAMPVPQSWPHDPRIRALVLAAPAVSYGFDRDRLAQVRVPLQLWAADRDEIVGTSAVEFAQMLPAGLEFHAVPNAGHFAFMQPCTTNLRILIGVLRHFGTPPICTDPPGFDRKAFHRQFNPAVVAFFRQNLR